jgi:serine/threonine protein kinase
MSGIEKPADSDPDFNTQLHVDDPYRTEMHAEPTPSSLVVPAPKHPTTIGRYSIVSVLGKGAFGVVYKAHDSELNRDVAIKVPLRRQASDAEIDEYLTEARTVASLDHRHIVPVYDVGKTPDGLCFVVSKFIPGGSLANEMRDSTRTPLEAAAFIAELADALHYAHRRGLVHRDIKPDNVLLDETKRGMIADFGLALHDKDIGHGPAFAGTPRYMSPEQASNRSDLVDARSDIFSLGLILHEMLLGISPFRAKTIDELIREIAHGHVRSLRLSNETIPPELDRICLKALAKEPANRYPTARDFAHDLRRFQAAKSSLAPKLALTGVAVLLLGFATWHFPKRDVGPPPTASASVPPVPQPHTPATTAAPAPTVRHIDLEIHLQRFGESGRFRVLKQTDLPLVDGDKIQIHFASKSPLYGYLYWVDAEGQLSRLWPSDVAAQQKTTRFSSPPEASASDVQQWHLIGGKKGTELVLALGSEEPLTAEQLAAMEKVRFRPDELTSGSGQPLALRGLSGMASSEKGLNDIGYRDLTQLLGDEFESYDCLVLSHR